MKIASTRNRGAGSRVLVTGASGFIGRRLVTDLRAAGIRVSCLVRRPEQAVAFAGDGVEPLIGDLTRPETLGGLGGFDRVFHLAGVLAARRREEFESVNVDGCRNLYSALLASSSPPARVVHVSSIAAGGPSPGPGPRREDEPAAPVSLYGRTKLAGEEVARAYEGRLAILVLRPAVVYGPEDRNLLPIFRMAARGWVLTPPRQPKLYSMIHVRDLSRVMMRAADDGALEVGATFHVSAGEACTWDQLVAEVGESLETRPRQLRLGRSPYVAAAWANALRSRFSPRAPVDLLIPQKLPELFARSWHVDNRKLWTAMEMPTTTLGDGIRETARWYREHGWIGSRRAR